MKRRGMIDSVATTVGVAITGRRRGCSLYDPRVTFSYPKGRDFHYSYPRLYFLVSSVYLFN